MKSNAQNMIIKFDRNKAHWISVVSGSEFLVNY